MTHEWGLLIVLYLFLGGLSAGLLAVSALATLFGGDRLRRTARVGAWTAPWPVLAGTALLVLDLGQPFYFWKLLVAFEPQSPMWLGTWLLTMFSIVSMPYAGLFVPLARSIWRPERVARMRRRLAFAGLPLGIGVGIYTGVLLGVLVARPLWHTPLLAELFLISALSSAAALLIVLLRGAAGGQEHRVLAGADAALIVIELVVLAWMLVDARTSTASANAAAALLTHGAYGWVFWLGLVGFGLLLPLFLETIELTSDAHRLRGKWLAMAAPTAPLFVLLGGLTLRWVFVYAGQVGQLL
jgi:formate-dependent nitrite reductase membrane component NrfD